MLDQMTGHRLNPRLRRVGIAAALATALAALITLPLLVPARSGPFCLDDCVVYPYADIARFYPGDYLWMAPAALAAFALVALAAALVEAAPPDRRVFAIAGFGFALIAATALGLCYLSQVEVVQPSLLAGEDDGIALITQYNQHGLFIALEDFGYLVMALALGALAASVAPGPGAAQVLRWTGFATAVVVVGAYVAIAVIYGAGRGYRFEVVAIVVDWLALVIAGVSAALWFRRAAAG